MYVEKKNIKKYNSKRYQYEYNLILIFYLHSCLNSLDNIRTQAFGFLAYGLHGVINLRLGIS